MSWGVLPRFADVAAPAVSNATDLSGLSAQEAARMGIFGPLGNTFGPAVTDSTAMQVATVYACLSKLGGAVSQLPLHHYALDAAGSRARVNPPSPIWWALNESPDQAWTAASWKEWIMRCIMLRGDQHTEILRRGSAFAGLRVHHPDCVRARTVNRRLRYDCIDPDTGEAYGVDQDDMLHFTGFGFNGERSMSVIKWAARNSVASALGAAEYMGKTLGEGGMPRITLEYANKGPSEGAIADLRKRFVEIYGSGNGSRLPLIMTDGGKATPLTISPVDLELLASRKFDKGEICEAIGVPPIIIGDSEKASSWGTGIEQVTIGWVRFGINPHLVRFTEEMNRKLFRRAGQFVEFELAGLLQGDSKAQNEAFRAALGGPGTGDGWMTVNEIRKLRNLPPKAGGDELFRSTRDAVKLPKEKATE